MNLMHFLPILWTRLCVLTDFWELAFLRTIMFLNAIYVIDVAFVAWNWTALELLLCGKQNPVGTVMVSFFCIVTQCPWPRTKCADNDPWVLGVFFLVSILHKSASIFSLYVFWFFVDFWHIAFVCVCVYHRCHGTCVKVREHLVEVVSCLLPCASWWTDSGRQAW